VSGIRTGSSARGAGNRRKRILIDAGFDAMTWWEVLAEPSPTDDTSAEAPAAPPMGSGRERVLASITARRGQGRFRRALLGAYEGRRAVTGTAADAVLEAAHIRPYDGPSSNRTSNGLLLRPDIHTLFDLDLLRIDPDGRVAVDPVVDDPAYRALDGRRIRVPDDPACRPDREALASRMPR